MDIIILRLGYASHFIRFEALDLGWLPWLTLSVGALGQALHLQLLSNGEETVEIILGHIDLPLVHEVQHSDELQSFGREYLNTTVPYLTVLNTFQVQQRMMVWISLENISEEWAAGGHYNLVSLYLAVITCKGHVKEVFLVSQVSKGAAHI